MVENKRQQPVSHVNTASNTSQIIVFLSLLRVSVFGNAQSSLGSNLDFIERKIHHHSENFISSLQKTLYHSIEHQHLH